VFPVEKRQVPVVKLGRFLRSARKGWWIIVLSVLACLGIAAFVTATTVPVYQSTVRFYVSAPAATGQSALQADQLARQRIVGYAGLLTSDRIVEQVTKASGVSAPVADVTNMISAFGDSNTLLLTVNVNGPSKDDTYAVASAVATNFNRMVNDLENTGGPGTESVLNVVAGPTRDDNPVSPRETLNLGLGLLLGLAIGVGILISRSRGDKSLRSTAELETSAVPLLATVPAEKRHGPRSDPLAAVAGPLRLESARNLRTILHFRSDADSLRAIAVASPAAGEGRTTVAVNLALSCAEAGFRTLLVETDLRRPQLAEDFHLAVGGGLADVLQQGLDLTAAVQPTSRNGLSILPAGGATARASELLGTTTMEALLATAKERYDVVILDTAPLLPFADARIVSALADGVLLVTRFGQSTPERIRVGLESLHLVRAKVLGTVFNGVPLPRGGDRNATSASGAAHLPDPSAAPARMAQQRSVPAASAPKSRPGTPAAQQQSDEQERVER
jgi:succinoglycan biosynthesis transport protein ExoP